MPRAYLRIDPNIDQTMPDLETFIRLMCAAARQPERGRFRDRALLDRALGRVKTTRALVRGDVVTLSDGRLYVEGWDEWQEGDHTVTERMKRMRARRAAKRNAPVMGDTVPPSPSRNDVTTDAVSSISNGTSSTGDGDDISPPPPVGQRKDGTNSRALGTNPRAAGTSPRQERAAEKRGGIPDSVAAILARAAKAGHS